MVGYFTQNQTIYNLLNLGITYDLDTFIETMMLHIETWLLQGSTMELTQEQIINGFENPLYDTINGGDYLQGANFDLEKNVLPVFNNMEGALSEAKWGMRNGDLLQSDVCSIRFLNDQPFINKLQSIYNGTGYTSVTQQTGGLSGLHNGEMFDMATTGIRFPPFLDSEDDPSVRMYMPHIMKIKEFKKSSEHNIGEGALPIYIFSADWPDGSEDIGWPNNNFY